MLLIRIPLLILFAVLVSILVIPFLLLTWWHPNRFIWLTWICTRIVLFLMGTQVEIEGQEHYDWKKGSYVFVGNHQSNFDYITIGKIAFPRTVTVGKKELLWVPLVGLVYWATGNIIIDRKKKSEAIGRLSQAVDYIRKNNGSICMFPEGTRNRARNGLLPFKKGSFFIAMEAGVPIAPVVCARLPPLVEWKKLRFYPGPIRVRMLPPISLQGLSRAQITPMIESVRDQMLKAYDEISS